jgi:hypothetical protein
MGYTYDSIVLIQSREIINNFKQNIGKRVSYISYFSIGDLDIDVDVEFIPRKRLGRHSYNIEAGACNDSVDMTIMYIPDRFPLSYNDFIAEVKEALRHEIEHVVQLIKHKLEWEYQPTASFCQYLLLRHEVPAHIFGLYRRAKTKRQPLSLIIDEFMNEHYESFQTESEMERVKNVWMIWVKCNLPKAQF